MNPDTWFITRIDGPPAILHLAHRQNLYLILQIVDVALSRVM